MNSYDSSEGTKITFLADYHVQIEIKFTAVNDDPAYHKVSNKA